MEIEIRELLNEVTHPESGVGIHEGGFVDSVTATPERISIMLRFEKSRDPFAIKIKKRVEGLLAERYTAVPAIVTIKEGVAPRKVNPEAEYSTTTTVAHIVAVASGKGGVGKSTVTANLAIALRDKGFRVGLLDADIYGPSQPRMFGIEGFLPEATIITDESGKEREVIIPAEVQGVKVISIGLFIKDTDPLLWRGTMASNALKQLLHQTQWGALDFLLVDLPPGTGDIHLTILDTVKFSCGVIVSTPQGVALADVVRGVEMFRHPKVQVPIAGIIENMAYFSPDDNPEKKYYLFGKGGATKYAAENGLNVLGEVPIYESIMQGGECGTPGNDDPRVRELYSEIAEGVLVGVCAPAAL